MGQCPSEHAKVTDEVADKISLFEACSNLDVTSEVNGGHESLELPDRIGLLESVRDTASEHGFGEEYLAAVMQAIRGRGRQDVRICCFGQPGAGKSSLINALRGVSHDDEASAPVGVTSSTTCLPVEYHHRHGDMRVTYVDNAGACLAGIDEADIALVVTCTRFTEFDKDLVARLRSMGKTFMLVRTKVSLDVLNERVSKARDWRLGKVTEESTVEHIRADIRRNMQETFPEFHGALREFLVDSQEGPCSFDLMNLREHIIACVPGAKTAEFLRAVPLLSSKLIADKEESLHGQIRLWAAMTGLLGGLAPIPGVAGAVNLAFLRAWQRHLEAEFGISVSVLHRTLGGMGIGVAGISGMAELLEADGVLNGVSRDHSQQMVMGTGSSTASISIMECAMSSMTAHFAGLAKSVQEIVAEAVAARELGVHLCVSDSTQPVAVLGPNMEVLLGDLSSGGEPLHLVAERPAYNVNEEVEACEGFEHLMLASNRMLGLSVARYPGTPIKHGEGDGNTARGCRIVVSSGGIDPIPAWRRHAIARNSDGQWLWALEAAEPKGHFIVRDAECSCLRLAAVGSSKALQHMPETHFLLLPQ